MPSNSPKPHTDVALYSYAVADRILIDVTDHGGGLPASAPDKLFTPFTQYGEDRSGPGLGLSILRRSVELNDGVLSVRNVPGVGCIFTMSLPWHVITKM